MASANLRLRLFGSPVVTDADGVPVGAGALEPHRLGLLALLALHPKRTVSRAELTNYLWSTRTVEQARNALNQSLFAISKSLGDDAIFSSAKEVRLGAQVSVDALEFQAALDEGRPEDATRLYAAPLMEGFELDDAPEFQQWAASQRARFATAARTQRPVADGPIEDLHDLSEPELPEPAKPEEPTPPVAPIPPPEEKGRKEAAPAADFALLEEPELRTPLERAPEGPELRAQVPLEPELLTNAVPREPERVVDAAPAEPELMTNSMFADQVANVSPPVSEEPAAVPPPQSPPLEDVQWIAPDEPTPAVPEATEAAAPPPVTRGSKADVSLASAAPAKSRPSEKLVQRRQRHFPRPSARLVVTVLVLVGIGALAYMARGWSGAAREGIEAARGGVAAVRGRADAARQARERQRSIAILPIEYSGRNQADAALAARIVEELGPLLTRAGLLVVPTNALTRRGPPYDLRVIADSLGVTHILQGAMQREGAVVAFRFRLMNPVDGTVRWEDTYRPRLADIPVLQEDVAATVGAQILRGSGERD